MLGSASYPIYVLHEPVGAILTYLSKGLVTKFAPFSGIVLVFILISISVWAERYYDIPVRRRITNFFSNKG
jgi:peptidoglycan/LPS O-acetylase OafA/YrhL